MRETEQYAQRGHHQNQNPNDVVHVSLQRRLDLAKGPGASRQLVHERVVTHLLCFVGRGPAHAEAARKHGVTGPFSDAFRLTREQRLVELHIAARDNLAIDDDLITGSCDQHVAQHDFARINLPLVSISDDTRLRTSQQRDVFELALGPSLLDNADYDVQEHQACCHHSIVHTPHQHQNNADGEEDRVDEGEGVLAEDLEVGSAGLEPEGVSLSPLASRDDFALRETSYLKHLAQASPSPPPSNTQTGLLPGLASSVVPWMTIGHGLQQDAHVVRIPSNLP